MRQAVYAEAVAMVEEYHAAGGAGAGKKLNCSPQVRSAFSHAPLDESSFFHLTGAGRA
jgi:hypothetical protein